MSSVEEELLKLVANLRAENAALTEIVLSQAGLLDKEVVAAESQKSVGKEPWYIRKSRLEKAFRKGEASDASEE